MNEKKKKTARLVSESSVFDGRVLLGLDGLGLVPVSRRHVASGSRAGVWLIGCEIEDGTSRYCTACGAAGRIRSSWRRRLAHTPGKHCRTRPTNIEAIHPHTEVERRTRFLMARIVPDKTTRESAGARFLMFSTLPAGARTGVTHDNTTESARHAELRERLGMATYFADPYPSYQRDGNENRNGAIRRHLPKRTRIDPSMTDEIQAIVDEINNRPMRVLGYRTPAEAFTDELPSLTQQQGYCTSK